MKLTHIAHLCSLVASLGSTAAKPFAATHHHHRYSARGSGAARTKRNDDAHDAHHSPAATASTALLSSIPRGGDLGPLSADIAAKTLVGFTIANGYPMWRSTEATCKSWGIDNGLSDVQKDLFKGHAFNMLSVAIPGVALLRGASARTAIGICALLISAELLCLIIERVPGKFNTPFSKGMYVNLWVYEAAAFANLLDLDWAPDVNKILAVLAVLTTAIGLIAPQKIWGTNDDEEALTELAINNWIKETLGDARSKLGQVTKNQTTNDDEEALTKLAINNWTASNAGIAALIIPLVVLDTPPSANKMIGYTHVPFALLCVYNAIFSKAAKKVTVTDGVRYSFATVMTVLVSATLL